MFDDRDYKAGSEFHKQLTNKVRLWPELPPLLNLKDRTKFILQSQVKEYDLDSLLPKEDCATDNFSAISKDIESNLVSLMLHKFINDVFH